MSHPGFDQVADAIFDAIEDEFYDWDGLVFHKHGMCSDDCPACIRERELLEEMKDEAELIAGHWACQQDEDEGWITEHQN